MQSSDRWTIYILKYTMRDGALRGYVGSSKDATKRINDFHKKGTHGCPPPIHSPHPTHPTQPTSYPSLPLAEGLGAAWTKGGEQWQVEYGSIQSTAPDALLAELVELMENVVAASLSEEAGSSSAAAPRQWRGALFTTVHLNAELTAAWAALSQVHPPPLPLTLPPLSPYLPSPYPPLPLTPLPLASLYLLTIGPL